MNQYTLEAFRAVPRTLKSDLRTINSRFALFLALHNPSVVVWKKEYGENTSQNKFKMKFVSL